VFDDQGVDARVKPGHDGGGALRVNAAHLARMRTPD